MAVHSSPRGAQVSHIHANVMVNLGKATAHAVRELMTIAHDAAEKKVGVRLESEIGKVPKLTALSISIPQGGRDGSFRALLPVILPVRSKQIRAPARSKGVD